MDAAYEGRGLPFESEHTAPSPYVYDERRDGAYYDESDGWDDDRWHRGSGFYHHRPGCLARAITTVLLPTNWRAYALFTAGVYMVQFLWFVLWDSLISMESSRGTWFAVSLPMWVWDAESARTIAAVFLQDMAVNNEERAKLLRDIERSASGMGEEAYLHKLDEIHDRHDGIHHKAVLTVLIRGVLLACVVTLQVLSVWLLQDGDAFAAWIPLIPVVAAFGVTWCYIAIGICVGRGRVRARDGTQV